MARERLARQDRRRHPRAKLQLLIQFSFETFDDFIAEYSTDISEGGMFIKTERPNPKGSYLYLRFTLNDGSPLIEGLGKVVRVILRSDPTATPGMGIEFIDFDQESMALIQQIVTRKLAGTTK
jgi:type IV pilus assembly protein PilZ